MYPCTLSVDTRMSYEVCRLYWANPFHSCGIGRGVLNMLLQVSSAVLVPNL
jgi:hypothetical protein